MTTSHTYAGITGLPETRAIDEASGPLLLTVLEAARRLGIGRSLLYELLATG